MPNPTPPPSSPPHSTAEHAQTLDKIPTPSGLAAVPPVRLEAIPAYEALAPHKHTALPLLLRIRVSEHAPQKRSPALVAICVDNSGSMDGDPIKLVLQSISLVSDHLREDDHACLVSFSNSAHVWLEPQTFHSQARSRLGIALQTIRADGSTAMYAGLEKTLQLQAALSGDMPRRVLLLTDGQPNVGPSSSEALTRLVRDQRKNAVVSTFGFGSHHQEQILQDIAQAGGGGYTYIESADSAPAAFAIELGALFSVVARQARLFLKPHDGCTVLRVRGDNDQRFGSKGLEVSLSDLAAGRTIELLADLEVDTKDPQEARPLATLRVEYWLPEAKEPTAQEIELTLPVHAQATDTMHPEISRQLLLLEAAQGWKDAQVIAARGDFLAAAASLTPLIERLKTSPEWADEKSDIRNWYEQLVDEKQIYEQRPEQGWYQEFRKQAAAEMQLPSQTTYTSDVTSVGTNIAQKSMMKAFRLDSGAKGRMEIYDTNRNLLNVQAFDEDITIGRAANNAIHLPGAMISKRHAKIAPSRNGFMIVDLKSSGGIFINGKKITAPTTLQDGDEIIIGEFILIYRAET